MRPRPLLAGTSPTRRPSGSTTRPASPTTSSTATTLSSSSSSSPWSLFPLVFAELAHLAGFDRYKISPRPGCLSAEVFRCYKDVMRMFFLVVGPLQLASYPSIKMIGVRTGLPLPSGWEIISQLTVYFMVEDYTNYWIHRFLHNKWGYEKIHKVHHEYTAPIGFAAPHAHWAEVLILGIPSFLGPAMVPGHMITFWLWIALRQVEAIETHSGYDFPWSPTKYIPFYGGAEYHDYHHYVGGHSQSNFASVFTYCDFIYGTDKGYRYQKKLFQKLKGEPKTGGEQNGGSYHISTLDLKSD
ncbi:Methylsterol monooxygenase 1-1 [Morella rubra]|uniref:Methylsterol monooxygenase 1-1 n=1 Tax=Morella rubra TaxID=262757 RepID=A0A6A1VVW8_9ROSI|nr:Methylsterol monooxygenase 1-1 [Morella rubra]